MVGTTTVDGENVTVMDSLATAGSPAHGARPIVAGGVTPVRVP
jgi:hypothetical protein